MMDTPPGTHVLELKAKRNKANLIYKKVGDHAQVARLMGITVREAYKLVSDGLDDELKEIKGIKGDDWSALNMREYMKLKSRLDGMVECAGAIFDSYYDKMKDKNIPEDKKPRFFPRELLPLIEASKKLLDTMDNHLERTGKFVRKTEMHFSWDNPSLMDDPEFRNFLEAIKDFMKKKGIDPVEFIEYMDEMSRKGSQNLDDLKPTDNVQDVPFEDVTDTQSDSKDDTTGEQHDGK